MSREIKFRVWDSVKNEMISNDLICKLGLFGLAFLSSSDTKAMQYIGLKDKSGVEIYEGDIIRVNVVENKDLEFEYRSTHLVEWCSGDDYPAFDLIPAWDEQLNSFSSILNINCFEMEVIGNIHENPELLEAK